VRDAIFLRKAFAVNMRADRVLYLIHNSDVIAWVKLHWQRHIMSYGQKN
jgi:hypothetical protein